ncbi:MAG TPA: bacterial transcriptional activator domain-containing protein, partial [Caldilineaceae bacterium]|nr:bacterial transcriptional activator domain-containing protein [Caldilineaceae bacterium]
VSTERTRLRERYLHGLQLLGDQLASRGDQAGAANALRRVLKEEPWREETHRQLMLLLAQSGQRRAALAQFELCRQALASELKVEPVAATLELLARIRDGEFDKVTPGQDNGRWQAGPVNGDRVNVVDPGPVPPAPSPPLPAASPLPATS